MDPTTYLKDRVDEQISWMEGKSRYNQQRYKLLKLLEIVAAAVIPFLAGFYEVHKSFPIITGLLGVFIVVLNGLQQLNKYHENWITYRTTIEALKREKILYESTSDPYNDSNAFRKFVQNFEAILANENKVWKANWMQKAEQK
ncbi:MAG: DUF4231 domain-containing protein [Chitinophagaceae bacterium]|nr:DUF4231 domain-containing protein [Chitinophagaceae bacterium]